MKIRCTTCGEEFPEHLKTKYSKRCPACRKAAYLLKKARQSEQARERELQRMRDNYARYRELVLRRSEQGKEVRRKDVTCKDCREFAECYRHCPAGIKTFASNLALTCVKFSSNKLNK